MTLDSLREQFPHTKNTIYLNHAATGPLSLPVRAAVDQQLNQRHLTNINNYQEVLPRVKATRQQVARLLNTDAERVAFVPNTSTALNIPALGLDWKAGDRVAVPGCEFPANVYPFLNLESKGVEVDFVPHAEGVVTLEDIERTLRPETRLLSISWVQFLSGFCVDLKAVSDLCHSHDVLCCVDAIQGLGALQLDVEAAGVDFVAAGAHKWLMATQGWGLLYVTEALQQQIEPPLAGWLHGPVDWDQLFDYELQFHDDASRFHLGTMNHLGITSLQAALELYEKAGPGWCEKQVRARTRQLREGFKALNIKRYGTDKQAYASGIVTIRPDDPKGLQAYLADHGVEVAMRNQKVRFSPTYYNSPQEIDYVLELVETWNE